jgi:hypothetical protein
VHALWFGLSFTWNRRLVCQHPDRLIETIGLGVDWERRCIRCGKVTEKNGRPPAETDGRVTHVQ